MILLHMSFDVIEPGEMFPTSSHTAFEFSLNRLVCRHVSDEVLAVDERPFTISLGALPAAFVTGSMILLMVPTMDINTWHRLSETSTYFSSDGMLNFLSQPGC